MQRFGLPSAGIPPGTLHSYRPIRSSPLTFLELRYDYSIHLSLSTLARVVTVRRATCVNLDLVGLPVHIPPLFYTCT